MIVTFLLTNPTQGPCQRPWRALLAARRPALLPATLGEATIGAYRFNIGAEIEG
jgi:hypothetical protein